MNRAPGAGFGAGAWWCCGGCVGLALVMAGLAMPASAQDDDDDTTDDDVVVDVSQFLLFIYEGTVDDYGE